MASCLLVVDVQNDFCPGGALAVPKGDEVVPVINRLAARFENVVLPGLASDHCVQGTPGAALHADLKIPHAQLVIRKGRHRAAIPRSSRRTARPLPAWRALPRDRSRGLGGKGLAKHDRRGGTAGLM